MELGFSIGWVEVQRVRVRGGDDREQNHVVYNIMSLKTPYIQWMPKRMPLSGSG